MSEERRWRQRCLVMHESTMRLLLVVDVAQVNMSNVTSAGPNRRSYVDVSALLIVCVCHIHTSLLSALLFKRFAH